MARVHAARTAVSNTNTADLVTVLAKYGVGSVIAVYLVWSLTTTLQSDVRAVQAEARGIRTEHVQMGMYLQAICYGVTAGPEQWRCRAADSYTPPPPPHVPALVRPTVP